MGRAPTLNRSLSLPLLVLYALGTTVGAGIYALVGAVAADAGTAAPVSFLIAPLLVAGTALSFAELASRLPFAASEAVWIRAAFDAPRLGTVAVLAIALAGTVSAATMLTAFQGYAASWVSAPPSVTVTCVGALLAAIAAYGVEESVRAAAVVTVIEVLGLAVVATVAVASIDAPVARMTELIPDASAATWSGVFSGSLLAFYAFLGFEDVVQVAEETVDPRTTIARAIVVTLIATTVLYVVLVGACVLAVDPAELGRSSAPLAYVFETSTGRSPAAIRFVGMLAVLNGGLVQIIMVARILYGLSEQGVLPPAVGRVHPRTRTPVNATIGIGALIVALAIAFPLATLARATSVVTLAVFTLTNATLLALKRREPAPDGVRVYPTAVPAVGFATSAAFFAFGLVELFG